MAAESHGKAITEAFKVSSGRVMKIYADYRNINGKKYPEFWGTIIKENKHRFKVGDWVKFEGLPTPIEIIAVEDTSTEQFVRLKGARKMCSSKMLEIAEMQGEIDRNCKDYQIIRRYLS